MISPVQRIPRYQLYLKDLLKHTYNENLLYKNYEVCLEKVKETLGAINSEMKQSERYIKPSMDLKKLVWSKTLSLVTRSLVAEDEVYLISPEFKPNNKTKYIILIFTDLVLLLKK